MKQDVFLSLQKQILAGYNREWRNFLRDIQDIPYIEYLEGTEHKKIWRPNRTP